MRGKKEFCFADKKFSMYQKTKDKLHSQHISSYQNDFNNNSK